MLKRFIQVSKVESSFELDRTLDSVGENIEDDYLKSVSKDYSDSGSESDSGSDDGSMDSEGTNNWLGQSLSQSQRINRVSQNSSNKFYPQAPVAQKIAYEVVFRRFQGEGVEFF